MAAGFRGVLELCGLWITGTGTGFVEPPVAGGGGYLSFTPDAATPQQLRALETVLGPRLPSPFTLARIPDAQLRRALEALQQSGTQPGDVSNAELERIVADELFKRRYWAAFLALALGS